MNNIPEITFLSVEKASKQVLEEKGKSMMQLPCFPDFAPTG